MLPFGQEVFDVRGPWIDRRPKLFEIGALRPFHFAIEVRRSRRQGTEFDRPFHHPALDIFSKELESAIGLDALDRKRHLLYDAPKKGQRALCVSPWINAKNLVAAAIIDRRILKNSGRDFADVHLHPLAWDGTRIFPDALTMPACRFKMLDAMPNEHAMDGVERQRQAMLADELIAQPLHAKATRAA